MVVLLWASKFATAKIECSFELDKYTPLGVPLILLLMVQNKSFEENCDCRQVSFYHKLK